MGRKFTVSYDLFLPLVIISSNLLFCSLDESCTFLCSKHLVFSLMILPLLTLLGKPSLPCIYINR